MGSSASPDFLDDESQQLILPSILCSKVLKSLHDDNGHQGLQHVLDLLHQKVYWPMMFGDAEHWLSNCQSFIVVKGDYTEPNTLQGSLVYQ